MKREYTQIYNNSIDQYIEYFKNNLSYKHTVEHQQSLTSITQIEIDKNMVHETYHLRNLYLKWHQRIFAVIPLHLFTAGERVALEKLRDLRNVYYNTKDLREKLSMTIDLYYNGYKVQYSKFNVRVFDDIIILSLPSNYRNFTTMRLVCRPYYCDFIKTTGEKFIDIPKKDLKNKNVNYKEFLFFVNNLETRDYKIEDKGEYYRITYTKVNVSVSIIEVIYIKNLVYFGAINTVNGHLVLTSKRLNLPFNINNILLYGTGGTKSSAELYVKTGDLICVSEEYAMNKFRLYYVSNDSKEFYYDDKLEWFIHNTSNLNGYLKDSIKSPEFVEQFKLFDKDISLDEFVNKGYSNIYNYIEDKIKETIEYDPELISLLYDFICTNNTSNLFTNKYLTEEEIDDISIVRNNSLSKGTSAEINFINQMGLIKVLNTNNYKLNIYLDGIRYFDYIHEDYINNTSYIYIKTNRLIDADNILIETVNTKYRDIRSFDFIGESKRLFTFDSEISKTLVTETKELRYLRLYKGDEYVDLIDGIKIEDDGSLSIYFKNNLEEGELYTLANPYFYSLFQYDTKARDEGFTEVIPLKYIEKNKMHFRVFKNGREIPRKFYDIDFTGEYPTITLNVKYTIYELIEIEYLPNRIRELVGIDEVNEDGKISIMDETNFLRDKNEYFLINGRRITPDKYKVQCTKGMTIGNLPSRKNFRVMINDDELIARVLSNFLTTYNSTEKLYSEYIIEIMKGGPFTNQEESCDQPSILRSGELYYDLYQEFLKHNILDMNRGLPDYIAFKYNKLVDVNLNNSILLDANEDQLYLMPLDGNIDYSDEDLLLISDLYYKLLDDVKSVQEINKEDIPSELYEQYKELFDKNCLIIETVEKEE